MPWYTKIATQLGQKFKKFGVRLEQGWGMVKAQDRNPWGMIEARSGIKIKIADGVK